MPQLSTFTRRLRAFLGLPYDNGHFTCHPENLKKGERLKVPGVVKRDAQDRSYCMSTGVSQRGRRSTGTGSWI